MIETTVFYLLMLQKYVNILNKRLCNAYSNYLTINNIKKTGLK